MENILQLSPVETFMFYSKNRSMINAYIKGDTVEHLDDGNDLGLGIGLITSVLLLHLIISIIILVILISNYKRMVPLYWWIALLLTFLVPGGFIIGLIIIFATRDTRRII